MLPNSILDMTSLLVPFCAGCLGFALVGLGALCVLAIGERPRKRALPGVELGRVPTPEGSALPADQSQAAA